MVEVLEKETLKSVEEYTPVQYRSETEGRGEYNPEDLYLNAAMRLVDSSSRLQWRAEVRVTTSSGVKRSSSRSAVDAHSLLNSR